MLSLDAPSTPMYAGTVLLLRSSRDGAFLFEDFYRSVEQRLGCLPRATECVYRSSPLRWVWRDHSDFRLDNHISEIQPEGCIDQEQLYFIISGLFARPMKLDHPLWSMTLISNVSLGWSEASSAVVVRVHRALLAETSITEWVSPLFKAPKVSDSLHEHCAHHSKKHSPHSFVQQCRTLCQDFLAFAHGSLEFSGELVSGVALSWLNGDEKRDRPWFSAPMSPFEGRVTRMRACRFVFIDDGRVDSLIHRLGPIDYEDLMITIIAGALRHWMQSDHELPNEPLIALVSGLDVKNDLGAGPFSRLSMLSLASQIENPLERLSAIRVERYKAAQYFIGRNADGILDHAPSSLVARGCIDY